MTRKDRIYASVFAAGFAAFLALIFIPDWKPTPPWFGDYGACLASHEEDSVITSVNSDGSLSVIPTSDTVCDAHEYPNGDGPDYQERYKRYEVRLAEWLKRHPEER